MPASWIFRLRYLKKHLLMLMFAFGWLLIQSQVAVASHDCTINVQGETASIQHLDMMAMPQHHAAPAPSALCDKHCVPEQVQKDTGHSQLVALPAAMTVTLNEPDCVAVASSSRVVTPPAVGPPATIRFCRFRE